MSLRWLCGCVFTGDEDRSGYVIFPTGCTHMYAQVRGSAHMPLPVREVTMEYGFSSCRA